VSDVNANIGIHFDTANALAQLRQLQAGLSKFNQSLTEGNVASANAQKGLNAQLMQSINATGKFVASQKTIASSTASFTDALEKNKLSMGQYFKYTSAAASLNSKMLQGFFTKEKEILNRASKDRVKALQTQYIQLTNANGELVKVLQVVPKHLQMVNGQYADYATRTQMAAQRQQFLNQLLKQGSTQLLNFGKNTQWAGRQLMVGLTVPLTMLGSIAAKTFRDMEQATVAFSRVYGTITTDQGATDKAIADIKRLAQEFTKFGIAASETVNMAAKAAAMGLTGDALNQQIIAATKLAVLGQVSQQDALTTTISLQNAFGISSQDLAAKINYLNAVENQTVLSIEDLTTAIPKAGPVIKQLGGSVEDLAFFMTAMKEGGINASEGANALKSGLASMINPSKKASEMLAGLGVNIKGIVEANAGDLKGTVVGFARALDTLDPLNRSRAIEQLFGKFQFARLSTLFQNVTKDSSQAATALGLAGASVEELAILSERELGKVENAIGVKFQKQIENLKIQLMPIGKAFLEAVTPIVEFAGKMLEKFNGLSDGTKKFVVGFIAVLGGIAPAVLMTVGLVANGAANLIKFFAMLRGGMSKLNGQNNVLGGGFDYLTQQEIENLTQSQALHTSHSQLIETFNVEAVSVNLLATAYANAGSQARALASGSPGLFNANPGAVGAVSGLPKKFASGGVVPGTGNGDTVPALLTPGEFVVTKDVVKQNPDLIAALSNKNVQKFADGGIVGGGTPRFIQKERDRIANLDDSQLIEYAKKVGMDVTNTSKTSLENVRKTVSSEFEKILQDVKAQFGKINQEGLTAVGKKFDVEKQSSRMGAYYPKFDQLQKPEFSHVGQTKAVDATYGDNLNLNSDARNQVELIKKFYGDGGGSGNGDMPQLKVADAHAFMLRGKLNNAMSTPGKSKAYEVANGAGSLGKDFQTDFEKTGAEKWRAMTEMMGGNFDQLKSQAQTYDKLLIQKIDKWNADNIAKPIPQIFDDATFKSLESEVTVQMQKLAPEFAGIVEQAKKSITAIRISLGQDFEEVNAMLKANNAGTLGPNPNNAKILNHEARPGSAKLLGTMDEGAALGDAVINGVRSKAGTDAASPSKKAKSAGQEVGDGLIEGMKSKEAEVESQSSKLGNAAVPTEKEMQKNAVKSVKKSAKNAGKSRSNTVVIEADKQNAKLSEEIVNAKQQTLNAAEQIALAEQDQAQSTVSSSQLSNAVEQNLKDSATTGDGINKAEQDRLASAEQVAKLENDIEEQKKKQKAQGHAALAAQMSGPQIPTGSQTNNKMINPNTAMGYEDAYNEAAQYTRDRNGKIIFDPELGPNGEKNPTMLNKKQIAQKKRGMRREKVGKYSGKAAGALGTATMVAGMAGAPPAVTGALGAASTVASFAPMIAGLSGPQGIVVGIVAVAAGLYLWNKHLKSTDAAQAKYISSISATTEKMKSIGQITGKVGASELASKQKDNLFQDYLGRDRAGSPFGKNFTGSDVGKTMQKAFTDNVKKTGAREAAKALSIELASYISDGVMTAEQANSIADAIGINLKDKTYAINIQGELRSLIGHNGEDLIKNPMAVRMNILQTNSKRTNTAVDAMATAQTKSSFWTGQYSGRTEAAQIAALSSNALAIAQAQADATEKMYDDQRRALEVQLAATTDKAKQVVLQQKLTDLTTKQTADVSLMNNLVQSELEKQLKIFEMKIQGPGRFQDSRANGATGTGTTEDAYFNSLKSTVKDKYRGTDQASMSETVLSRTAKLSDNNEYKKQGFDTKAQAQSMEVQIDLLMAQGQLSPNQANSLLTMFDKQVGQLKKTLDIGARLHGTPKTIAALELFTGLTDQTLAAKLGVQLVQSDPATFDRISKTMASLQFLDGQEINLEAMIKVNGYEVLNNLSMLLDTIDKKFKKGPITLEYITKFDAEYGTGLAGMGQSGVDYINSFKSDKDKNQAIKTYQEIKTSYALTFADEASKTQWIADQATREATQNAAAAYSKAGNKKTYEALYKEFEITAKNKFTTQVLDFLAGKNDNAVLGGTKIALGTDGVIDSNTKPGSIPGAGTRDATYDELNKRLRNVRNSAIDAAGGFKELQKAIAATGDKAIGNKFKGLEQQLIKMGQTSQFTDYLAGLDQKELNKFGKTAKKAGTQKYKQLDPVTGKMVTKTQKFNAGDFVLNQKGRDMEQGYKKAIIGDYNKEQLKSVTLAKQEIAARGKLLSLGFDEVDIKTMLADENYKTLIATGKVTDQELKTNAALTAQARIRNQINGAVAGQKDLQKITANQKRIPEVIKMMQQANMNAEAIRSAISDPAMLDTLINGMDNFATLAKDAQAEFNHLLSQIDEIPERKLVEIVFTQTREEKITNAAKAALEMLDAYKMIDENTLKNAEGNTYAGLQTQMENLNNQAKIVQDRISITQSQIDTLQQEVDKDQRDIETKFTRPIEQKQRAIDKLSRSSELNFARPIQALQDRSAILSHDLEVMNHAADQINEKYDKQQEALAKVSEINQQIIEQQQQQLGLADALSSGDIAAAARAVQGMRSTSASNYAQNADKALQQARQNEIDGLRGGTSGKSQKDIQEEQYQIGQKTYALEQAKAIVEAEILRIQDEIYNLEQSRQVALDAIQVKTDAIAKLQYGTLLDQQNELKVINDKNLKLQLQSDLLALQISQNDANRIIQDQTRSQWELTLTAATAAEKLAKGELATALAGIKTVSGDIKGSWEKIRDYYDAIKSKSITISQYIETVYGKQPNINPEPPSVSPAEQEATDAANAATDAALAASATADAATAAADAAAALVEALVADSNALSEKIKSDLEATKASLSPKGQKILADAAAAEASRLAAVEKQNAYWAAYAEGMAKRYGYSSGGIVPKYFATGGFARGTDTVPAMLTPGEFVMSRYAVNSHGTDKMNALNSGASIGDSVYNYNLNVSVRSDANPNEIARTIMAQIKQVDSQRIKGNKL
jgi:hypothetical protein